MNFYQDESGQKECKECPKHTTNKRGSSNCFGCKAGMEMGRIKFEEEGEAGSSNVVYQVGNGDDDVEDEEDNYPADFHNLVHRTAKCAFLFTCPSPTRNNHIWQGMKLRKEKDTRFRSIFKDGEWKYVAVAARHFLWFRFKQPRVIVAFSYQVVEGIPPIDGKDFVFYGTNSNDCQSSREKLYTSTTRKEFLVKIEHNKKAFKCYGFSIYGKKVAIRPPVKVCTAKERI